MELRNIGELVKQLPELESFINETEAKIERLEAELNRLKNDTYVSTKKGDLELLFFKIAEASSSTGNIITQYSCVQCNEDGTQIDNALTKNIKVYNPSHFMLDCPENTIIPVFKTKDKNGSDYYLSVSASNFSTMTSGYRYLLVNNDSNAIIQREFTEDCPCD